MKRLLLLATASLTLGLLFLVGCSAPSGDLPVDDGQSPSRPAAPTDDDAAGGDADADAVLVIDQGVADGPGISVTDALGWEGDPTPLLVNGALFVNQDGDARLCEAIAESFPPQCGGARLRVEGLELTGVPDLQEANGVRWAESVQLFGRIEPAD